MNFDLKSAVCLGVAGNFTGHLEQAGEDKDFCKVVTAEKNAPKALFPTYIPPYSSCKKMAASAGSSAVVPSFLNTFPFDNGRIIFPHGEYRLQPEPECAVVLDVQWDGNKVCALKPVAFAASNDCSIRRNGAKKISMKKNWGASSKGIAEKFIPLDSFESGCILDRYRISSFLIRSGSVYEYGEDSAVRDYSYIYKKLELWLVEKMNFQKDEGAAEDINSYLNSCGCPRQIMVSIGATRYTDFGEHNFLQDSDFCAVVLYPEDVYTPAMIRGFVEKKDFGCPDISFLYQKIIIGR